MGVGRGSCSCGTVGFMADSGMFVMVCGHGISAFPNRILIKTEFPRRGKQLKRVSSKR